jgi:hypothetical protein
MDYGMNAIWQNFAGADQSYLGASGTSDALVHKTIADRQIAAVQTTTPGTVKQIRMQIGRGDAVSGTTMDTVSFDFGVSYKTTEAPNGCVVTGFGVRGQRG